MCHEDEHNKQAYKKKKARYKGIKRMNSMLLNEMVNYGNTRLKVFGFVITNSNSVGEVTSKTTRKPYKVKDIAKELGIAISKCSLAISELIKAKFIKKNGRTIVVSPYMYVPYNISDDKLFILQTYWDSDFTVDITDELEMANKELELLIESNTHKVVSKSI